MKIIIEVQDEHDGGLRYAMTEAIRSVNAAIAREPSHAVSLDVVAEAIGDGLREGDPQGCRPAYVGRRSWMTDARWEQSNAR